MWVVGYDISLKFHGWSLRENKSISWVVVLAKIEFHVLWPSLFAVINRIQRVVPFNLIPWVAPNIFSVIKNRNDELQMSRVVRKPVFGVADQVPHKMARGLKFRI